MSDDRGGVWGIGCELWGDVVRGSGLWGLESGGEVSGVGG